MAYPNGWDEYKTHVVAELGRLNKTVEQLDQKVDGLIVELATLKTRLALFSSGIATAVGIITTIVGKLLGG